MTMTKLLSTPEVAEILGVPIRTLNQWAYLGLGPNFIKVGKYRRYPTESLRAWLAAQPTGGTAA
jgi:DNA-binding transcriptional MerR regulator